jgi:hypothetical protein
VITDSADVARSFTTTPPSWVDSTTVRSVDGWWAGEGAIRPQEHPDLPFVPGSQARLGREGLAVRATMSSVGAVTTFVPIARDTWITFTAGRNSGRLFYRKVEEPEDRPSDYKGHLGSAGDRGRSKRVAPAIRIACGPLDPALAPPGTSRSVFLKFTDQSRQATKACETFLPDLASALTHGRQRYGGEKAYVADDSLVLRDSREQRDYLHVMHVNTLSDKVFTANLDGPPASFDPSYERVVSKAQKHLAGFQKLWRDDAAVVAAVQEDFYSLPNGLVDQPEAYAPYDPMFTPTLTRTAPSSNVQFVPVGFAMPIIPTSWAGIARQDETMPMQEIPVERAFEEATK